ncbi:hypothetical protein BDZ89DRAFT_703781 [Hymenopellis radicata]|nr:hypothetical protein BDZ89DRAFT_703781 [Hymenopellis radicata]
MLPRSHNLLGKEESCFHRPRVHFDHFRSQSRSKLSLSWASWCVLGPTTPHILFSSPVDPALDARVAPLARKGRST